MSAAPDRSPPARPRMVGHHSGARDTAPCLSATYAANPVEFKTEFGGNVKGRPVVFKQEYERDRKLFKDNDKVVGCSIPIKDSLTKLEMNKAIIDVLGVEKNEVGYIGDNVRIDGPSLKYFGLPVASPYADEETQKIVSDRGGVVLKNYKKKEVDRLFRRF